MKKNFSRITKLFFNAVVLFGTIISLASCDLLIGLLDNKTITEKVEYNDKDLKTKRLSGSGNVYYVKYNKSDDYIIYQEYTGYIKEHSNRSEQIIDEESIDYEYYESRDFPKTVDEEGLSLFNSNEDMNILNNKVIEEMSKLPTGRSALISSPVQELTVSIGQKRNIYLTKADYDINGVKKREYSESRTAVCKYTGSHCNVWFIDNNKFISEKDLDFKTLGEKFDEIYKIETSIMGSNIYTQKNSIYIDSQSKIDIVVCDCYEDAKKNQDKGTFGYQSVIDLYTNSSLNKLNPELGWSELKSNESQMIFIDSQFYAYNGEKKSFNQLPFNCQNQIYSALLHEFNHLLNNIQKNIKQNAGEMKTWYTEMLSLITEDLLKDYMKIDDESSARGRLNFFDEGYNHGFTIWLSGEDVYYSYANVFAYGAYLCRNYGGERLIKEIATNNYVNDESITKALQACGYNKNFEDTLMELPYILINLSSTGITLNKSGPTTTDYTSLTPINLKFTMKNVNYEPKYYSSGYLSNCDIYPNAFTLHYVGKNIKTVKYFEPKASIKQNIITDFIYN